MWFAYLDASALVKRYVPEAGTTFLNYLFARVPTGQMLVFNVGIAEVVSILVRKHNANQISLVQMQDAWSIFMTEIMWSHTVSRISADDLLVRTALPLIETHSINATDAIILRSALDFAYRSRTSGDDLFLVAADQRLFRAAVAEGLTAINPETASPADLDALLGP